MREVLCDMQKAPEQDFGSGPIVADSLPWHAPDEQTALKVAIEQFTVRPSDQWRRVGH
jgi:hypothetical protein